MKHRIHTYIFIFVLALAAAGCGGSNEASYYSKNVTEKEFAYPAADVIAFCVDEEGLLYAATESGSSICCYDPQGSQIREYRLGEGEYTNLCIYEDNLYCYDYKKNEFLCINLVGGDKTVVYSDGNTLGVVAMTAFSDALYMIRRVKDAETDKQFTDGYINLGERLCELRLSDGALKELEVPNVKLMTKRDKDNLYIYAFEKGKGFYFSTYNIADKSMGVKEYLENLGFTTAFDYIGERDELLFFSDFACLTVSCSEPEKRAEFYSDENIFPQTGNDVRYSDGCAFILNNKEGKGTVTRLLCKELIKENVTLKALTFSVAGKLDKAGYRVEEEVISEDELEIKLLAGDYDYDFAIVSTDMPVAQSMLIKGAYCPLEGLEGVENLLDTSFDYIREALTDSDGKVWALPLYVDTDYLLYNDARCREQGIDMGKIDNAFELVGIAGRLYENQDFRRYYGLNYHVLLGNMIDRYFFENIDEELNQVSFDNEDFRQIVRYMRDCFENPSLYTYFDANPITWYLYDGTGYESDDCEILYHDRLLFELKRYKEDLNVFLNLDSYRVLAVPPYSGEQTKNPVTAQLLIINPNSSKLNTVLEYVNELALKLAAEKDTFFNKNIEQYTDYEKPLLKDMYDIFANGKISFGFPKDVFWDAMLAYRDNKITEDDLISELERRVSMYLFE